jgi:chromosomal replication initiation ATPase DnaA
LYETAQLEEKQFNKPHATVRQAADYFGLSETELTKKRGSHRQQRAFVMELLHRYSGLKQRGIADRMGGLDEGVVSRDRSAIREKIEKDPKIRKCFQELCSRLST